MVVRGLGPVGDAGDEPDRLGEGGQLEGLDDLVALALPPRERGQAFGDAVVVEALRSGHDPIQAPGGPILRLDPITRNGSGGETRTLNISVNSRTLCRLSYPGMALDDSSARTRPMIRRCVGAQA